jgi:hypothetical protein
LNICSISSIRLLMNGRLAIVLLFFLFSDGVGVYFLRVDPHGIVYPIRAKWLDAKIPHGGEEVFQDCGAPTLETGSEAAPESPASAFENALTRHVLGPLARTMEAVPIAFHCNAPTFPPLNNEIDSESAASHLGFEPVASLRKRIEHVTFEIRLAAFAKRRGTARVLPERFTEMPEQPAIESVVGKGGVIHGAEEILPVSCTRKGHIEALFLVVPILSGMIARC